MNLDGRRGEGGNVGPRLDALGRQRDAQQRPKTFQLVKVLQWLAHGVHRGPQTLLLGQQPLARVVKARGLGPHRRVLVPDGVEQPQHSSNLGNGGEKKGYDKKQGKLFQVDTSLSQLFAWPRKGSDMVVGKDFYFAVGQRQMAQTSLGTLNWQQHDMNEHTQ